MILEVSWDDFWTLSFGLSQLHGSWLVCGVALRGMDMATNKIKIVFRIKKIGTNLCEVEGCVVNVMAECVPVEVVAAHPGLVEEILQTLKQLPLLEIPILERLIKHGGPDTQDHLQRDGAPLDVSLHSIIINATQLGFVAMRKMIKYYQKQLNFLPLPSLKNLVAASLCSLICLHLFRQRNPINL